MKKKTKRAQLKNKLWKLISEYVRRKDADPHTGLNECVTCKGVKHWKELQAGHFVAQAQGDAARYELDNIHPQCYRCNINLGGNGPEFYPYMIQTFGEKRTEEIRLLAGKTVKLTLQDLEERINIVESALKSLDSYA